MRKGPKILLVIGVIVVLCWLATVPNLLRSPNAVMLDQLRSGGIRQRMDMTANLSDALKMAREEKEAVHSAADTTALPEKKLIRNAELGLTVADVHNAVTQLQKLTELNHAEIDRLEIMESTGGMPSATIVVRVPASGLTNALEEFKKIAVRTEHEQIAARDVTLEFYDNETHLRNLHAEERQYLEILKQAHTVKNTLEVTQKLNEVTDRIERLQTQIHLLTHDIEMSVVTIVLIQETKAQVLGLHWNPLFEAKAAIHDLLEGLGGWFGWMLAAVIKLPLIILWISTIAVIAWTSWRVVRLVWKTFLKPKVTTAP